MDLARSPSPFSLGEAERLRDFFSTDFSLERLLESRSDFALERLLERLLERDLRTSERERDFCVRERDRDLDFLERDFVGDLE